MKQRQESPIKEVIMTQFAKVGSKGQVTVPAEVRTNLKIKAGDTISWDIQADGHISMRRVEPINVDYLGAINGTLSEWNSSEDDEAYREL